MEDKNKVVFIIAHRYVKGYPTYIKYYIDNIKRFYENHLIIVVDNNSIRKEDVFDNIEKCDSVVLLENNTDCKFELGAYMVGMRYLMDKNIEDYEYIVFTQDNYVIKNKVDFNDLYSKNVMACPIVGCGSECERIQNYVCAENGNIQDICIPIYTKLDLMNDLDKITFCWCVSFIVHRERLKSLYDYTKQINISIRWESEASERYMARILYELNGKKNHSIDGDWNIDLWNGSMNSDIFADSQYHFVKTLQKKTEKTIEE